MFLGLSVNALDIVSVNTNNDAFVLNRTNFSGSEVRFKSVSTTNLFMAGSLNMGGNRITNRGIFTNTSTFVFNSDIALTNTMSVGNNSIDILHGHVYIASTNGLGNPAVFSSTARFTAINSPLEVSDRIVGLYTNMGMVCTIFTNSCPAGSTNLYVVDTSGFSVDNTLYLMGSNEFVTVASIISSTNLTTRMPTRYGHTTADGVSRSRNFGSLMYYNVDGTTNFYSTISFPSAKTVIIGLQVEYK
jgi:hypothetical protein